MIISASSKIYIRGTREFSYSLKLRIGVMCMRYLFSIVVEMAIHSPSGEIANLTVLPSLAQGISYDRNAVNPAPWSLYNR
jgi:hypothetical protein